jgi:short-subunit dehydrogenase
LKAAQGKVAIISSQLGSDTIASGGNYIYRASKAVALNLGRNLAVDMKLDGNAVGIYPPGWVQTDMGGDGAAITPQVSADGLIAHFDMLSLSTTGCFQTNDGQDHPF